MAKTYLLTTTDNPWNPHTHWDEWYRCDIAYGYNTCGYLARLAMTSDSFSPELNARIIDAARDEIVRFDLLGIISNGQVHYIKVDSDGNRA